MRVSVAQGLADRLGHLQQAPCVEPLVQRVAEGLAVYVFHREVERLADVAAVNDRDDVGMAQGGERFGLLVEALHKDGSVRQVFRQHLQGHGAVQRFLGGLVDDTHGALGDLLLDAEARYGQVQLLVREVAGGFPDDRRAVHVHQQTPAAGAVGHEAAARAGLYVVALRAAGRTYELHLVPCPLSALVCQHSG